MFFEAPIEISGSLMLIGSTRGVVCFHDYSKSQGSANVYLSNPLLGKFKIIPPLQCSDKFSQYITVGFGFYHIDVDFRVVNILYDLWKGRFEAVAWVYGEKIGSWRSIAQDVPCCISRWMFYNVFVNGILYWLAPKQLNYLHESSDCIMGFDVVEEVFKVVELPQTQDCRTKLFALHDKKSLAIFSFHHSEMAMKMWVLNDSSGFWEQKYSLDLTCHFFPEQVLCDGNLLAMVNDCTKMVMVDVDKEVNDRVKDCGMFTVGFTPSLTLPTGN